MLESLAQIAKDNPRYNFSTLVVDDNSPDGTGELVTDYLNTHSNIYLLQGKKKGLGEALIRGYLFSMKVLKADIVVSNDADFQFDPLDIPLLLKKIDEGSDVVVASRHARGGGVEGWPTGRRVTHFIANNIFATNIAGLRQVTDHQGDFRAVRVAGILDRLDFEKIKSKSIGYGFLNFMIFALSQTGATFTEVPIKFHWRELGETKVSFTPKYFKTFFRDTLEYIYLCVYIRYLNLIGHNRGFLK